MSYPHQYPHQQPTWLPQQQQQQQQVPQSPLAAADSNTPAYLNPAFAPVPRPPGAPSNSGGLLGSLKKVVTGPRPYAGHHSTGSYGAAQSPQQQFDQGFSPQQTGYTAPYQQPAPVGHYPQQQQPAYSSPPAQQQRPAFSTPPAQPHQPAFSSPPAQTPFSPQGQPPPAYQPSPPAQPQQPGYQTPYQHTSPGLPSPGFTPAAPYQQQQAAGLNWNDLFETTTSPPKATPKLSKILTGLGECIIQDGGVDGCPSSVIPPAKMATYYAAAAGYSSDCLRFFQAAATKPNRLAEFYRSLGCEYLLIPPKAGEGTLLPALTLKGFEQWSIIQILLFPEFAHQQLTAYLSNPAHTIKDPDTNTCFPSGGPPRAVLPPIADPTTFQRYGSMWDTTMKATIEQSDIDSQFDKSAQKLTEAMEQLNMKTAGEQKLIEEHKRSIHELYAEISRLQQALQDKDNEVLKVKASRQESDHLVSEKEREIKRLNAAADVKEQEIKRLNAAADVKERDFLAIKAQLEGKDIEFQRAIQNKDSELAQCTRVLQEKDIEVQQVLRATEAKEEELRQLRIDCRAKDFETVQARRTAESKESEISLLKTQLRDMERDVQKTKSLQQESEQEAAKLRRERTDLVADLAETKKALAKKDAEIHVLKSQQVLPLGAAGSAPSPVTTPPIGTTSPSPYAPRGYEAARRPTMEPPVAANGGRRPTIGTPRPTLPYPENP